MRPAHQNTAPNTFRLLQPAGKSSLKTYFQAAGQTKTAPPLCGAVGRRGLQIEFFQHFQAAVQAVNQWLAGGDFQFHDFVVADAFDVLG